MNSPDDAPGLKRDFRKDGPKPITGTVTDRGVMLGVTPSGTLFKPVLMTSWLDFVTHFGALDKGARRNPYLPGAYAAHMVRAHFDNGGSSFYFVRMPASVDAASTPEIAFYTTDNERKPRLTFTPRGTPTQDLQIVISSARDDGTFDVEIVLGEVKDGKPSGRKGDGVKEIYSHLSLREGEGDLKVMDVINRKSRLVSVLEAPAEDTAGTLRLRSETQFIKALPIENLRAANLVKPPAPPKSSKKEDPANPGAAQASANPEPSPNKTAAPVVNADQLVGDEAERTGVNGLMQIKDMRWLAFADLWALRQANRINDDTVARVLNAMVGFCTLREDCVAVIDAPPGLKPTEMREWREEAQFDYDRAALYYPWLQTVDPSTNARINVPPSGYVTGVFSRTDRERGVWKAPANEVAMSAIGLETEVTEKEHGLLNEVSVNVIKLDNGVRIMGARTLTVTNKQYKYLPVRRLSDYIMTSAIESLKWVTFEPNSPDLWAQVKRELNNFLHGLWRRGALFGESPAEAYEVICDKSNNSDVDIENGELHIAIKIRAVKPAEYITISLSHRTVEAEKAA